MTRKVLKDIVIYEIEKTDIAGIKRLKLTLPKAHYQSPHKNQPKELYNFGWDRAGWIDENVETVDNSKSAENYDINAFGNLTTYIGKNPHNISRVTIAPEIEEDVMLCDFIYDDEDDSQYQLECRVED